ncbi:hypothetical protein PVAND_006957 [Polypedilum vanderplanki]|uniref:Uncharacterized protein n=1 Tax=Polypedilum vanderplanki TaxID=319348 RepID=A0A9J6C5R4_POLVA|nr:hypothetical protein PVAND_006957 [Polypedilum vanderplanki]
MGNLVTKVTTNSVELNESIVSDIVIYEKQQIQVKKEKQVTPTASQTKAGLFKSMFLGPIDPRSPSTFITRTPIQIFRSVSSSKFNHQELLNESLNESVEIDILTAEEQESLESNQDLVDAIKVKRNEEATEEQENQEQDDEQNKLPDPRSPTTEIVRTPIYCEDVKKAETNLIKKITDKMIATKISHEQKNQTNITTTPTGITKKKSKTTQKNLIYKDDENENVDRFSTPPKKSTFKDTERTPLSCVANKSKIPTKPQMTSTPKGSKIPISMSREQNQSSSRIPRRIE